jgi:hypothetical protein
MGHPKNIISKRVTLATSRAVFIVSSGSTYATREIKRLGLAKRGFDPLAFVAVHARVVMVRHCKTCAMRHRKPTHPITADMRRDQLAARGYKPAPRTRRKK